MEQLLNITSVPIKYELSVTNARVDYKPQKSQVVQDRIDGNFQIQNKPARLLINTRDAMNSVVPSAFTSIRQAAQKGMQNARDVSAQIAMDGKQFMNAAPGADVLSQVFEQHAAMPTGEFQLAFIPTVGPEIKYQEADFQMQYQADKLQFDVRVSNGNLEYVAGSVSMNVTQWPDVVIEYIGRPMYVPPSSAERFEASA